MNEEQNEEMPSSSGRGGGETSWMRGGGVNSFT